MRQEPGEAVDNFISRIKNLAAKCQFRDTAKVEDRVLDQLIETLRIAFAANGKREIRV